MAPGQPPPQLTTRCLSTKAVHSWIQRELTLNWAIDHSRSISIASIVHDTMLRSVFFVSKYHSRVDQSVHTATKVPWRYKIGKIRAMRVSKCSTFLSSFALPHATKVQISAITVLANMNSVSLIVETYEWKCGREILRRCKAFPYACRMGILTQLHAVKYALLHLVSWIPNLHGSQYVSHVQRTPNNFLVWDSVTSSLFLIFDIKSAFNCNLEVSLSSVHTWNHHLFVNLTMNSLPRVHILVTALRSMSKGFRCVDLNATYEPICKCFDEMALRFPSLLAAILHAFTTNKLEIRLDYEFCIICEHVGFDARVRRSFENRCDVSIS